MPTTPRIIASTAPHTLDVLQARSPMRYGIAVASVAVPASIALILQGSIGNDFYLTVLFVSILLPSVLGGLGPGLLATALALVVGHFIPSNLLTSAELRLVAVEGVFVSIVGGTLRVARRKARQRLLTNLNLEQRILEIGDEERRRIGHDLHDGLGQHLTGISLLSEGIAQQIEGGRTPERLQVETITRLVSEAVQITRDLAKSLSPITLEKDGFVAAVEELAETSSSLFGIDCRGEFDDQRLEIDRTRSLHLYRIVQEAVNNSVKHGKARHVHIQVRRLGDDLSVKVTDDGSGLSQKTMNNPGLGLRIMGYRARILGASLAAERATESGGTVVTCTCPINGEAITRASGRE